MSNSKIMKTGIREIIIFTSIAVGVGGCLQEEAVPPLEPQSRTLAVINGLPVMEEQFEDFLSLDPNELESDSSDSRRNILFREFVTEQLLLQEARRKEINVLEQEVQRQLDGWLSEGQEATPALRERVRALLTIQAFIKQEIGEQITIGNQEMQKYYRSREEEYIINDQAHVLEILLDERGWAEEIHGELNFGDVRTFKNLARKYSSGLTSEAGGDLGAFERGELPEDFEKMIFELKPGEISPVFRSAEGFHIFMMEEWVPRHAQKFYEVQDTVFGKLVADKERVALDRYVEQLFLAASVEIHDEDLDLEWEESRASLR